MKSISIMVTESELFDSLKGDLAFTQKEAEAFIRRLDYIEDAAGEWFALNADRVQSTLFSSADTLEYQKVILGWVAFWQCVFNGTENGCFLEQQALGAIRGLFFASAAADLIIPSSIQTSWHETVDIHHQPTLGEWA
ncbi:hypothetical protein [Photobacterium sp. Hal280]|uniref:hypothetical protein n=1 Tax=Photobacterium sp. Hal280 TaxID=3035163 RepID=UPI00301C766C